MIPWLRIDQKIEALGSCNRVLKLENGMVCPQCHLIYIDTIGYLARVL
jgi:hypothetical protein